jgi:hypothetical protein
MIKIKVLNENSKETFILINEDTVVTVEPHGLKHYRMYLVDGRMILMTKSMYEDNFEDKEDFEPITPGVRI